VVDAGGQALVSHTRPTACPCPDPALEPESVGGGRGGAWVAAQPELVVQSRVGRGPRTTCGAHAAIGTGG
jgi:hypothetical protein